MLMTSILDGSLSRLCQAPLLRPEQRRRRPFLVEPRLRVHSRPPVPIQSGFVVKNAFSIAKPKPDVSGRNTPGGPQWILDNQPLTNAISERPSGFDPAIRVNSRPPVPIRSGFAVEPALKLNQGKSRYLKPKKHIFRPLPVNVEQFPVMLQPKDPQP